MQLLRAGGEILSRGAAGECWAGLGRIPHSGMEESIQIPEFHPARMLLAWFCACSSQEDTWEFRENSPEWQKFCKTGAYLSHRGKVLFVLYSHQKPMSFVILKQPSKPWAVSVFFQIYISRYILISYLIDWISSRQLLLLLLDNNIVV